MSDHIPTRLPARFSGLLLLVWLLAGCAGQPLVKGQTALGTLQTIGPNVRVNGQPAADGQVFRSGQNLGTGPGSSVYLHFQSGGYVQLDENTDPVFTLVWAGEKCVIEAFQGLKGQVFAETNPQCQMRFRVMGVEWTHQASAEFNLKVQGDTAELTVLEGKLIATAGGRPREFGEGYMVSMGSGGIQGVKTLTPEQMRPLLQWLAPFPAPCGG